MSAEEDKKTSTGAVLFATICFIVAALLGVVFMASIISPQNSEYQNFDIAVGDTFTYDYKINTANVLIDVTQYPFTYGRFLLSTKTPGTYEATITTSSSSERVGFAWAETFSCNQTVGDKFNRHEVTTTCNHWEGARKERCVSDSNSDCTITMTQAKYEYGSELQMYLSGNGKGSVIIRRLS